MTASDRFSRGSLWRIWDFHIHTPYSYNWGGKARMPAGGSSTILQQMVDALNASPAEAFVVMDYWTFDGYLALRDYIPRANPKLTKTVFPGMELRCTSVPDARTNIHVILSDDLTAQKLSNFKSKLKVFGTNQPLSDEALAEVARGLAPDKIGGRRGAELSEDEAYTIGASKALVTFESLSDAVDAMPADTAYIMLPFDTYGGVAKIQFAEHPVVVTTLMKSGRLFEVRKEVFADAARGIETAANKNFIANFQETAGGAKPPVSGSDAHRFKQYGVFPIAEDGTPRITWVKADTTFHGFRQLGYEPAERVYIGAKPPKLDHVAQNTTRYIRKLEVRPVDGNNPDGWFDFELELNPGLVAVIGNKGSGKSALADIVALLGAAKRDAQDYSFLNESRFLSLGSKLGRAFRATLTWEDGSQDSSLLSEPVSVNSVQRVRYLPQSYLEKICSPRDSGRTSEFERELESVIFSRLDDKSRLGQGSLRALLEHRTRPTIARIASLRAQLHETNVNIVASEKRQRPSQRLARRAELDQKNAEIAAHDKTKPQDIVPSTAPNEAASGLGASLDSLREELSRLDLEIAGATAREKELLRQLESVRLLRVEIATLREQVESSRERMRPYLQKLGLPPESFVSVEVDEAALATKSEALALDLAAVALLNNETNPDGLARRRLEILATIDEMQRELDAPAQQYQEYLTRVAEWQRRRALLEGDAETPGSRRYLEQALSDLEQEPERLDQLIGQRDEVCRAIHQQLLTLRSVYEECYHPVQEFSESHATISQRLKIRFEASLTARGVVDLILDRIHQGVTGAFYGKDAGRRVVSGILSDRDVNGTDDCVAFAREIVRRLGERPGGLPPGVDHLVEKQLASGQTLESFYDFMYGLEYVAPHYRLSLDGKDLDQLSPGERGAMLLVFYLLVDPDNVPLIVDQPEENLDNRTVFELLGECIREAKRRRQIVLVTHNANLAIACDAEQIIRASIDKRSGNRVTYLSGSIENREINQHALDILEGTRPAIENRRQKYHAT